MPGVVVGGKRRRISVPEGVALGLESVSRTHLAVPPAVQRQAWSKPAKAFGSRRTEWGRGSFGQARPESMMECF